MSKFIELSDYDASIHREILDALTREDDAVVEICEDRAVAEMRCYLSRRYDCDKIFTATGDKRNQLVLMMAIDIAVYHIFCNNLQILDWTFYMKDIPLMSCYFKLDAIVSQSQKP